MLGLSSALFHLFFLIPEAVGPRETAGEGMVVVLA